MFKTEAFDAARYLTTPEAQEELLSDAPASGSAAYVAQALGVIARARGMTEIAREAGLDHLSFASVLLRTLGGRKAP